MWIVVLKIVLLILLTQTDLSSGAECSASWLDCGNGKCVSEIWHCDGDNDCGNFKDEQDCDKFLDNVECLSSQFVCESDRHCIPERWHCDGEKDCDDGSDELRCDNVTEPCTGFICRNHHCIPTKWHCDGNEDCSDGSDEEFCSSDKMCADWEFVCSSGSCINQSLVCDKHNNCVDGSDEGVHCGDPCENITCSQNCRSTPAGPQCYCNDGYSLDKDNKTCSDINECLQDGFCSHECINTIGSYKCSCKSGYDLVNRTCRARGSDPLLVFTTLGEIRAMHLRVNEYFLVRRSLAKASAVDVDPKNKQVYWLEISNRSSIYSSAIDGSDFRTVLSHGLLVPEDIAVDYVANNLYITDSRLQQVLACKIDGSMCTVLHDTNVKKPRSIALDPAEGLMYWSDWGEHTSGIYRSGMDGSHRIPLVITDIAWPNGIAIDHSTNRLYWADAKLNRIEYISLNGSSRKMIYNESVFHPYALSVFEDTIYWTDWSTFSLEACNKFTGHNLTLLARENGAHMMGVHVYHPVLTARVSNPCWSSECSHMCLISPTSGFRCACPNGFQLGKDGKTCIMQDISESIFISEGSSVFYIQPKTVGSEAVTEVPLPLRTKISKVSFAKHLHCLFVADGDTPAIHAVNMSSLHMSVLVKNNIVKPEDLAFDSRSNNLYWVDSGKGTVEALSVESLRRVVLVEKLNRPVALAISPANGIMFISTVGSHASIIKYGMDGKNGLVLHSIHGWPLSVALHPSKPTLYWADPRTGTIYYVDYENMRFPRILVNGAYGVLSVAASEEYVYWTSTRRELSFRKANVTHVLDLPGQEKRTVNRKVTYSPGTIPAGKSACIIGNGNCSYLCLTSPRGRTCACPSELMLDHDNVSCVSRRCEAGDFKCVNGQCIPPKLKCDGNKDCEDGSDEVSCSNRCIGDDFQCKNGRCILKSWQCDKRNDCIDNSDEENCPSTAACTKGQMTCRNGECIPVLWQCDGENDCVDGTDETNCNLTRCDSVINYRCDTGQCIPISWLCDGSKDCYDNSDERNCTNARACLSNEFKCKSDESCIDEKLKCDGRPDCKDESDEKDCPLSASHSNCKKDMYRCKDGSCIYDYEVCDGHGDCSTDEEELNCTHAFCQPGELLCPISKRCISKAWICDGDADCSEGSDEENCVESKTQQPKQTSSVSDSACDNFYCYATGQCLPWSKVCDGRQDCEDLSDEGGLCSRSCANNGGCSHICKKSPYGPRCFCDEGYRLLPDNKTCDDINECLLLGSCSHYCNNTKGGFKCNCAEGYVLHNDRRLCKAIGDPATVVYLLGDQIRGFNLHTHNQHVIVDVNDADMQGMDYDLSGGVFFWTERNDRSINIYSPAAQKHDVVVRSSLRPSCIRYDWITGNLYLKDESSSIVVCTRDVGFCKTLIEPSLSYISSMDISPSTGLMFWTVWANPQRKQYSGLIERAEMDGSHRLVIVSDKTNAPTAVTVDHVLNRIYWADKQLNTLESVDFHGFQRTHIVQSGMYHPSAVAVFEDNVYWADWGSDSIMRCNKFTGKDCANITDGNVKAHILLIVHKVMQPKVANRCQDTNCTQLCLLTRSGSICACDEIENGTCGLESESVTPMSVVECPKDYCQGGECSVKEGEYICKCSPLYSGRNCEVKAAATVIEHDQNWIVAVVLAVVVTGIIILAILMCFRNREKLHEVGESISVKFRNAKSGHDSRLVMDTDDGNMYDELVLEKDEDCKQASGHNNYTVLARQPSDADENDLKKWESYGNSAFTINTFGNFFRKLKINVSML